MLRKTLLAFTFVLAATAAGADDTWFLVGRAWPADRYARLPDFGRGVGVVFSPDLSVEGNCRFYQALGFACFQDADWDRVLSGIREHNIFHPENRIRTLILETHGTNGNGLKLQKSKAPGADRSYISVGALQERLDPDGIRYIVISACNSGRLLRPSIYLALDPENGDKLFLPPTRGIINATPDYDPARSGVTIITPASSHIETTLVGSVSEFAPLTRRALQQSARTLGIKLPREFAVSDLVMQIVSRDPRLRLTTGQHVDELSEAIQPVDVSEKLYRSFLKVVDTLGKAEAQYLTPLAVKTTTRARPR